MSVNITGSDGDLADPHREHARCPRSRCACVVPSRRVNGVHLGRTPFRAMVPHVGGDPASRDDDYFGANEKLIRPPSAPVVATVTVTVPPRVRTEQSIR